MSRSSKNSELPTDFEAGSAADVVEHLLSVDDEAERRTALWRAVPTLDVEGLLRLLKSEAERQWTISPSASLRLAEALIAGADMTRQPHHRALGLMAKADALRYLGRYTEAGEYFDAAANEFLTLGDEVGWARTRIGWVLLMYYLGRTDEALAVAEQAHAILVAHQEWFRAAGLNLNTALVCRFLGRYQLALLRYDRALDLYQTAQKADPSLEDWVEPRAASVKANKAIVYTLLGDFRSALPLQEEAQQIFLRHGETVSGLRELHNVAHVFAGQGHFTRALQLLTQAVSEAKQSGLESLVVSAQLDMVECYLALNRDAQASDLAYEAFLTCERSGTPTEGAKAQVYAGFAQARIGNIERAAVILREAQHTFVRAGLQSDVGIATLHLASAHLADKSYAAALEEADQARAIFVETGETIRRAQAELVSAQGRVALGHAGEARVLASSGLAVSQDLQLPWLAYGCHHVLARAAESEEDLKEAQDQYELAIGAIERVQSGLLTEFRSNFLADKMHVYGDAIDCCLRQGRVDVALDFLERAKSRALVDYLAQNLDVRVKAKTAASQELADELSRLREEHNWFYNRLYDLGTTPRDDGVQRTDAESAHLRGAIADREKRIGAVLDRLLIQDDAQDTVAYAIRSPGRPKLDAQTVLLEYYLREDSGEVFVLSTAGLRTASLGIGSRAIQRILLRWQLNHDAGTEAVAAGLPVDGLERNARGILESLYQALFGPVERYLASFERIVVIPYGPLHGVPFHALHDGHAYTAEKWEISVCPSSGLLSLCASRQRRGGDSMLVVACSDAGRLPHVVGEAQTLAALFPGECLIDEQATCRAVAESAAHHAVIHLAAHAEARLDNPTFAHLKLHDGQLSTVDVFNMELDGTVVVLSACETGRGVVAPGDEVIGLSRGVLHAGAATLIHSLWRVDDGSTAQLMEEFYRHLRAGSTCNAALRNAMLAICRSGQTNLYAWAAFQLVGDGGTRLQRMPPAPAAFVTQATFDEGVHTRR